MVNSLKSFLEVENQAMLPTKERMDKWASKRSPRFGKNSRYRSSRYQNDSWAALGEVKKRQIFEKEERYPSQEEKFSKYLWWTDVA